MCPPFLDQLKVVFDDQIGQRGFAAALAACVVRDFGAMVGPVFQDRVDEPDRQRQPFAPRGRRQTVKFLADAADDEFQRQRPVAVQRPMEG